MDSLASEDRIVAVGREIFARVRDLADFVHPIGRLGDVLLNRLVSEARLRTQLFRFVDTLPALHSSSAMARHLREYLGAAGIRSLGHDGVFSGVLAAAAQFAVRRMGRRFIVAEDLDGAVASIRRLRRQGLAFTVDLLGEAVIAEDEAERYQRNYLTLIESLAARVSELPANFLLDAGADGPIPRVNVSIKLSALFSQFDALDPAGTTAAVLGRLRPILRLARQRGVFVNLDMEQWAFKDLTIAIFKSVLLEPEFRDWPDVGIAVQAYLRSSADDLADLARWAEARGTPVWIRLVKGAYWDYEAVVAAQNGWPIPVFTDKAQTDAAFESSAAFLMEHRAVLRPAIASHNIRSIAAAMAAAERFGVHPRGVEYQMLYGMADPIKAALVEMGRRVRVYAPMGPLLPGMAYLVRRLLENTSNESFLRADFVEHVPEEQLLMRPTVISAAATIVDPPAEFRNEPPTDFSRSENRAAMTAALAKRTMDDQPLIIGGRPVWSGQWMESANPSHKTGVVGRCARATATHALDAVAAAKSAFPAWRDTTPHRRADLLDRVAELLRRRRFELAALEVHECGKPWREADADVAEAIDFCRYYARQMRVLAEDRGSALPGEQNSWSYEPRGVAVVIAPWNFPLAILCGMTAAAVVTGNPAIMKPAEQSQLVGAALASAFLEAGAPPGVANFLPGIGEEVGPVLVEHPDVAIVAFTGSCAVGLSINQRAAVTPAGQDHIKRVLTELGGKNAIIIDDDADLDEAVAGVVASAFGYAGQKCSACSRAIVLEGVREAFCARLVETTRSLSIAPAEDPACRIGPVIDAAAMARIHAAIERGKGDAKLLYAGELGVLTEEGFYVAPHIFADVPPSSGLAREEIFGPVLAVMAARDIGEALAIANGTDYALTGGIYSRSPAHIERCRREFRVGNLYINRRVTGALVGRQPFGGFKLSGGGTQAGGPDYLRIFLWPRCITENTLRHGFAADEPGIG